MLKKKKVKYFCFQTQALLLLFKAQCPLQEQVILSIISPYNTK